MPGVTFHFAADGSNDSDTRSDAPSRAVRRGLDAPLPLDHFSTTMLTEGEQFAAGAITYEGYPVQELEVDGATLLFEGRIYADRPVAEAERAARLALEGSVESLAEWVSEADGEFVLTVHDPASERVLVLNDAFGRLPVYRTEIDGRLVVSRDVSALLAAREAEAGAADFDELAIAQSLLFGFPLGTRTLYEGVEKLAPGTLLTATADGVSTRSLHEFDLERLAANQRGSDADVAALAEQFVDACRVRADPDGPTVISLSGGHDSRAVAAGFDRAGTPVRAATFDRADGASDRDLPIAESVATELDVPWKLYDLAEASEADRDALLSLKRGLNHVGMAFILPFLETLREEHGPRFTYATGDGGDKALPDLTPSKELSDVDELTKYVLSKDSLIFALEEVTELIDVSAAELRASLRAELESYPETAPAQKYKHYKVRERGLNWLIEGEDRNRAFAWSTTPFYSLPFFETSMSFADDAKANNGLYRRFMRELWPAGVELPDANYGVSMDSRLYTATMYFRRFLANHPGIEDVVRMVYRGEVGSKYDEQLAARLRRQLEGSSELQRVFDADRLAEIAADRSSCNRQQAAFLLTMTSVVAAPETPVGESVTPAQ